MNIENEKTYDAVFWTSVVHMKQYVIPLVNEAFGKHFSETADVRVEAGKQVVEHFDGSFDEREMDALITLTDNDMSQPYHFEIETWYDSGIILRIAEYSLTHASDNRVKTKRGARVNQLRRPV